MTPTDALDQAMATMFDHNAQQVLPRLSKLPADDYAALRVEFIEGVKELNSVDEFFQKTRIPMALKKAFDRLNIPAATSGKKMTEFAQLALQMFQLKDFAKPSQEGNVVLEMGFGGEMFGGGEHSFPVSTPPRSRK